MPEGVKPGELFVKEGTKSEASEKAVAQISRAVHDYFLFSPAP
jgi:hypothetical protein